MRLFIILGLLLFSQMAMSTSFIFMGDTGTGKSGQYAVSKGIESYCAVNICEYGLLLGDNFYPAGVSSKYDAQWQDKFELPYRNLNFKFYAILGNHDYMLGRSKYQLQYASERWSMPSRFYTLSFEQNVEIFALDTEKLDAPQLNWLQYKLENSKAKWRIVIGHHPVYSGGEHGDTQGMIEAFMPIAKKYGVDFYLSGHDHDQQVLQRRGINFVVAGAGAKVRNTSMTSHTLYAASLLGFSHMQIQGDKAKLRMLDQNGKVLFEREYIHQD